MAQDRAHESMAQNQSDKDTNDMGGLLEKALTNDFESFIFKPFLFFKSGHILSEAEKNALVVACPTDSTYAVRLYSLKTDQWELLDSISDLDANRIQFDMVFDDYNFDGQTDLYIQDHVSNGWALSRGHLITIDPITKKLDLHKEASDFGDMEIDAKTKTIRSELWNGYDRKGRHQLTVFTHKWVNGRLKTMGKKNIAIE